MFNRAIVWLQDKRDASIERSRGPVTRREEGGEYRIGRLKHERVKVPRGNTLLEWAMQVMKCHVHRKSMLEIEFQGEEGTGLGPSLEFYALVAAELQKKELGMWLVDDDFHDKTEREVRDACNNTQYKCNDTHYKSCGVGRIWCTGRQNPENCEF